MEWFSHGGVSLVKSIVLIVLLSISTVPLQEAVNASSGALLQAYPASSSSTPGPRIGLDFAWYVRNGFGSLHGVNPLDGAAVYDYLTHGWQNSGGQSGGFFTAYAYELHSPPLYPPQYIGDANWLLSFIHAANADAGGQRAKIFVRLVAINNFDSTLLGTLQDFLQKLGPASQNPSVAGFGFRGAQEGIYEGGGTCCGGPEGVNFIPATIAYGPTGMNSFPQSASQYGSMWNQFQSLADSYGYSLGISTSMSSMDKYLGQSVSSSYAQWFIEDTGYGACGQSDTTGTCTYNTWYSKVANPPQAPAVAQGVVGGEWDQNWFVPGQAPYYITQTQVQAMFHGFADGYAKNPSAGQYMFIYGMPYLTNDDPTWVKSKGPSPYMSWFLQYAQQYGFMTDYSPAPPPGPSGGGSAQTLAKIPTGLYVHISGDPALSNLKPGWTQTNPVLCCGTDTFSVDGQLTNIETGQGTVGAAIQIMSFDFTTCTWKVLATATTNQQGYYGQSSNSPTGTPIILPSPVLPNTGRNQAYFYPVFAGDSAYGPSNGVLEDLLILPSTVTSTTSTTSTTATTSSSTTTTTTISSSTSSTTTASSSTSTTSSSIPQFDFDLATHPQAVSVPAGSGTASTLSVALLQGQPQMVSLYAVAPPGLSVSFGTSSGLPGFNSVVFIDASGNLTPGVYPVVISGSAGQVKHSANISVTVEPQTHQLYEVTLVASPSGGGSIDPAPGNYQFGSGTTVNITAIAAPGWRLDRWVLDGAFSGNGAFFVLPVQHNTTLEVDFAQPGAQATNNATVAFSTTAEGPAIVSIDGTNFTLPVSFSWQLGSHHQITTLPVLYQADQTRAVFLGWHGSLSGWPGVIYGTGLTLALDVEGDTIVSPNYLTQYHSSFTFTDCKGSSVSPTDVLLKDQKGRNTKLSADQSAWLTKGVLYQVFQAYWMGLNVATLLQDTPVYQARGPQEFQAPLPVCDFKMQVSDVFGSPISGATAAMSFGRGAMLFAQTDAGGVATFPQAPEGPFNASVYYLGVESRLPGNSYLVHSLGVSLVFSVPVLLSATAFFATVLGIALIRRFKRNRGEITSFYE